MKKNSLLIFIFFLGYACKKTDSSAPPSITPEVEQQLTITTEPGNSNTIDVKDTLNLKVNITSKMPSEVTYSIDVIRLDSSKSIYKIDSASKSSSLNLSIPVFQSFTLYSTKVTVTSKSKPSNTVSLTINLNNDVAKNFQGYKVDPSAKSLGTNYWTNTKLQADLITNIFQNPLPGQIGGALCQVTCGDFNNDGWIDVFNPGWSYNGPRYGVSFLIWNPITKVFDDKNLLNDKRISFGGNQRKTIPVYLNSDNYVDLVIADNGDEGIQNSPPEPIRIVLSDGKGGYDLKEIPSETPMVKHEFCEVGDLNNDGKPELLIANGPVWFIMWGISDFPYFTTNNIAIFHCTPDNHLGFKNNNGFGESVPEISNGVYGFKIDDINKDGWKDIILSTSETKNAQPYPVSNRILINQGNGKFNKIGLVELPYFDGTNMLTSQDFIADDVTGDGKVDLICVANTMNYQSWEIFVYVQQNDGSFKIDKNIVKFNFAKKGNWKPELFYTDINGDGLKDVGYYNDASMNKNEPNNLMGFKTVFIREGNNFVEKDYYQFDPYANYLKKTYLK